MRSRRENGVTHSPGAIHSLGVSVRGRRSVRPVRDGNRLEPRVRADRPQQVADVVPHGLGAEVQLLGDLPRRPSAFQQLQHFGLARGEVELRMRVRFLEDVRDLPEHADDVLSVEDRHGRYLDANAAAFAVDDHRGRVGGRSPTDDLPHEQFASPPRVLGCYDRRELSADDVTDNPTSRRIDPPHDAVCVNQVTRHIDVLERFLEIQRVQR